MSSTPNPTSLTTSKFRLVLSILPIFFRYFPMLMSQKIAARIHQYTYRALPASETKNVVVVGGSFTGIALAKRLADTLPSGYRVVLIEKHSHFNYLFNFPRYSVLQGHEAKAFVPYTHAFASSPPSIVSQIRGTVTSINSDHVRFDNGEKVEFGYLAIATGVTQLPPANVRSSSREGGCAELAALQRKIAEAKKIAIVGGGAVGVQLSADIATFYPGEKEKSAKEVVLVHSREVLLPSFGERLGQYAKLKLGGMGVKVVCGERPTLPKRDGEEWGSGELTWKDGRAEQFDLIIPATGPTPNSSILASMSPNSINEKTRRILVTPTLQVQQSSPQSNSNNPTGVLSNIFALGDVAETGGPKMGRAGMMQAEIVTDNILSLISANASTGKIAQLRNYKPMAMEGAIKLGLGKEEMAMYMREENGREHLLAEKSEGEDLGVKKIWGWFGARMSEDDEVESVVA